MFKKSHFLLLLFPLLAYGGLFDWWERSSPKAERAKKGLEGFDALIEKALKDYQVPGIAVGVVVDGHVVYAKGFGCRDVEKHLPVTTETLFPIGSCTKSFTSFLAGTLVDEGLLGWDQPVIDVLAEFRLWDLYATTSLTVRDLLTHRSGMPRHEFVLYNSKASKADILKRLRHLQPSFEIRERYQYGNLMYFTAGLMMERVTGRSWEDLMRERILEPLAMTHTNFSVEDSQKTADFAVPYLEKQDRLKKMPFLNLSLIGSAGALNSNIHDMMHWIQMQLSAGNYENRSLISSVTLQELYAPQVIVPGAPETKETLLYAYGIGWGVLSYRGHHFVSHDGVSAGFTCMVGLLPGENVGMVILSNKNMTTLPRYISFEIIDRILDLPRHDWFKDGVDSIRKSKETVNEIKVQEDRMRKKGTSPCHPLEDYVGIYEHPGYGPMSIDLVDGRLEATYNDLTFVLDHWHYDVFSVAQEKQDAVISFEGTKFTFCNNSQGDIGEVSVPFEPAVDDIVFKRKSAEKHSTLAYLRQFTGVYEIYGYTVEIIIRDHALIALIPGQPNYELIPAGENEFTVKTMTASAVRFVMDANNKVQEILLIHPYGAFSALPKGKRS